MHQLIDRKKKFLFLFLILIFLSSINSQNFIQKKDTFYALNNLEVEGLEERLNLQIKKDLNFLYKTNIFSVDKKIIKDQINTYNFIENYNILKFYPSKIILKLKQVDFLAQSLIDNKIYLIGSNGKFISTEKFNNYKDLPLVYGKFEIKQFFLFKEKINKTNFNYKNIQEIFFYPSGRIDIKTKNNILIKLPLKNMKSAILMAKKILNMNNFNNNIIDLRASNQIILSNE